MSKEKSPKLSTKRPEGTHSLDRVSPKQPQAASVAELAKMVLKEMADNLKRNVASNKT